MHSGHRERMRERFRKHGFETFHNHEIIEMVLYSTIPRRDTNPIAHTLIERFGSFSAVFDAPFDELLKVDGIGEATALSIKLFPAVTSAYLTDKTITKKMKIIDDQTAYKYFYTKYVDKTKEMPSALYLTNSGKVIMWEKVGEGMLTYTEVAIREIAETAIRYNCSKVVLCHNHPTGIAIPSVEDYNSTRAVTQMLKTIGVDLVDHIVIGGDDYVSMKNSREFSGAFI